MSEPQSRLWRELRVGLVYAAERFETRFFLSTQSATGLYRLVRTSLFRGSEKDLKTSDDYL